MVLAHLSPPWFFGIDVALEFAFALVALLVALFALRMYRQSGQRLPGYFGFGFILISVSYFIQSVFNFLIVSKLSENLCHSIKLLSVNAFDTVGTLIHVVFMTAGLSVLLYTTLKDKRQRTLWLLFITALAAVIMSPNTLHMFFVISSVYLAFISWHYILNYYHNRRARTLLVALAFLFLLFGSFHFLISVDHQLYYAIGHILELFAYTFILINLYLVRTQ